jgi:endoglucanase
MTHFKAMIGLTASLAAIALQSDVNAAEQLPDPAFAQPTLVGEWWATPEHQGRL